MVAPKKMYVILRTVLCTIKKSELVHKESLGVEKLRMKHVRIIAEIYVGGESSNRKFKSAVTIARDQR